MNKIVLIFLVFSLNTFSQKIQIEGVVLDATTNQALSGASIMVKKKGTQTNLNGEFKIKIKKGTELSFSYLGYQTQKVIVNNSQVLRILLKSEFEQLNDVIVVAKKNINDIDLRKATSAISVLKPSKIKDRASINTIDLLQGQVAGVSVKSSGELGSPVKIRIRGTSTLTIKTNKKLSEDEVELLDNRFNQPLFVLDGQIISANAFATLNINDVEEIKVLKDASANALYGVKASNGVIEITSKRGINGATQYSFSSQQGITFKGKTSQEMMETKEKLAFERLSKNTDTPGYLYSKEYITIINKNKPNLNQLIAAGQQKLDSISKINTNWFNELARISTYNSYNLSTRGGSAKNKFYISSNFAKQGGKFEGNDIQRFSGRLNYEYKLSKKVYVMLNSGFSFSENNTPNSSDYSPSELMYTLNPYEQKEKGELISYSNRTFKDLVNQYSRKTDDSNFNFSANINATLLKNLQISTVAGIQYDIDESLGIVPPTAYSERKKGTSRSEQGSANKRKTVTSNMTTNTRLSYQTTIEKHDFSFSGNMDYYKNTSDFIGIFGHGLPSKLLSGAGISNDLIGAKSSKTSSRKTTDATLGFGLSTLYSWDNMFNVYGSFKRDASSLLPSDKRWNTFYAIGFSYTLNDNSFLKNIDWVKSLGFRSSFGKTASLSGITPSLAVPTFGYGAKNYLGLREFSLKDLYNKDLRPEQSTSINLGLDFHLLKSLRLSADIYHRRTSDMLLTVPIAPSNGFNQQLQNVGVMDNRGVEVSLRVTPVKTESFSWSTSLNCAYNENKVIDLYAGKTLNLSDKLYPDYEEGKSANILYGLRSLGISPAEGSPFFLRKDGSRFSSDRESPNLEDFVVLGTTTPPFNGGFYNNFTYNNFQFSFDLYYSFGGTQKLTNLARVFSATDAHKNLPKNKLEQTWFELGDEGKIYPTIFIHGKEFWTNVDYASTDNIGSTDFIRMNNMMLKYKCDENYVKRAFGGFARNANCYMQLKNVGYWSNFKGGDPETANLKGSSQPIFTMGLNIGF